MATSFVEQAILRVKDQSTKPIRKINAELKKLRDEARKLKSMKLIDYQSLRSLDQAQSKVNKLSQSLRSLPRSRTVAINTKMTGGGAASLNKLVARKPVVNIRPNLTGKAAFEAEVKRLIRQRTMNVRVQATGGAAAPRGGQNMTGQGFAKGFMSQLESGRAGQLMGIGFVSHVGAHLSAAIISAVGQGIREGVTDFSVSDATREILGVQVDDKAALDAMATSLSDKFPEFTQGQIERILTDAYGAAQGDITTTKGLINGLLDTARQTFLQGRTAERATEGGNLLFTAAEATRVTDANGNIDLNQLSNAMEDFRVGAALVGEAFDPGKTKTLFTRMAQIAGRFDRDAIPEALLLQEAGLTANDQLQFGLQFGTAQQGTDEARAFREANGLATREAMETADRNQIEFFQRFLIPAFEKAVAKGFEGDIDEFSGQATSRQTSDRAASVIATQGTEISNRVDRRDELRVGSDDLAQIASENQRAIAQSLSAQFESAISRTVEGMAPVINPVFETATKGLNFAADQAQENPAAAATALLATTVAINQAVKPLVKAQSAQALISPETSPANKALISAALTLDGAANKLVIASGLQTGVLGALAKNLGKLGLLGAAAATLYAPAENVVRSGNTTMRTLTAKNRLEGLEARRDQLQQKVDDPNWVDRLDGMFVDFTGQLDAINQEIAKERAAMAAKAEQNEIDTNAIISQLQHEAGLPAAPTVDQAALLDELKFLSGELANAAAMGSPVAADIERQMSGVVEELSMAGLEIDPTTFVAAGDDLTMGLSRTIDTGTAAMSDEVGGALSTGGAEVGTIIRDSLAAGAQDLRSALSTPINVNTKVETPRLGQRLDTGSNTPQ